MEELIRSAAFRAAVVTGEPLWLWVNVITWRARFAKRQGLNVVDFISIKKEV